MSNLRKLFFATVAVMTVFGVVGFVPAGAKAAVAGDLIKMAGNPAVYYFDGSKRYVFPQENVYKSWYKDFSGVQTISQSELQSYPIGGNVTMRPGTWMVKITTDPKVYAVTPGGVLHWVDSEARAVALYGANWNKMIVDVSDAFFVNYTTGTAVSSNTHPDGSVIMRGGTYYYVMGGNERPFASEAALAANMINTAFAITTTMDYPDGTSITGAETALTNVAGSSSTTGTSAAGLTVSGGTMTASTSLPKGANSVKVGTWNFAAGPEGSVTLNQVTFHRSGVGNTSDISNAYIYDGANRLTSGRTFNSSTNDAAFTLNLDIPAGSTKALSLYVSIATGAAAGDEHVFGVEAASAVSTNAASVNGVFPVNSNKHSIAGATAGTVAIAGNTALTNPRVGDKGAKVSEFKLSPSTEDAYVNQITLTQGGNISNSALSNFMLKQNGTTVATATGVASNERLDLVFSPAYFIEKGNDRVFELYADIGGRPADTIAFYVEDIADVMVTGGTFGLGMTASINANFDASTDQSITLQGGQFTIVFDGPSSANISNTASDVVIWKGTVYTANEVEVRNWRFRIQDTNATDPDLADSASTAAIQDIKLWNLSNNTVIAGPMELTAGANNQSEYLAFTDDYIFAAGSSTSIGLSVDVKNNPAGNITLLASMSDGSAASFSANDIKNTGSNTYLTVGTDVVPGTSIVGQNQTVVAAGLTVATAPSPTDSIMIKGASSFNATSFNFTAGSGSSVKVNTVAVTAGTSDTDDNEYGAAGAADTDVSTSASVSSLILSAKLMYGTTQIGTSKSFVSGVATFDNLNWTIPASATQKLDVVITTNSAATLSTTSDFLRLSLEASSVTAVDANGNSISTVTGVPVNTADGAGDVVVTVKSSGSLTASLASTPTNPSSGLHAAGSTDKVLAAFKFEAIDDSFLVKKLTLIPYVGGAVSAASNDRVSSLEVRYPKQAGGTQTTTVGLSGTANLVDISAMPMYVPQNGTATLEVLADFSTFSLLDGTEDENITFGIDSNNGSSNNQATGVASNTDDNDWGTDVFGNQQNVYRTVLTVAAGSGTPNNTARTRSAAQKVASWNLNATSGSNAVIRGSKKAPDSAITGWAATDADSLAATIATAGNFVSGASAITSVSAATTASVLAHDFGASAGLDTYQRVSAWVRLVNSSGAGAAVTFDVDDTALLASPQGSVAVGTSSTTATWYYVDVTTASLGVTAATRYVGLTAAAPGAGTQTMIIDDLRFYRDSINVDVSGNLIVTIPQAVPFLLKDSGGSVRAYGAYNGTATVGTVKLIAGDGADVAVITDYSDVEISSSTLALDLETNTSLLMLADTTANESLSVSIDTGNVSSAGDISWYDNSDSAGSNNMAAITVANPVSTTITFANTY